MKRSFTLNVSCFAAILLIGTSISTADDAIKQQILKLFPQADTDKDGVISDAEEAVVSRQDLKRYPKGKTDRVQQVTHNRLRRFIS